MILTLKASNETLDVLTSTRCVGGEGEREVEEGEDTCVLIVDSLHCTAESNTAL